MDSIAGNLQMLGNSTRPDKEATEYSVIEIGDTVLRKMIVSSGLDNYLPRGLNQDGISEIYFYKRRIMGIRLPDGKLYYEKNTLTPGWFFKMVILSIITTPLFGMGLVLFYATFKAWVVKSKLEELQAMGGVAI